MIALVCLWNEIQNMYGMTYTKFQTQIYHVNFAQSMWSILKYFLNNVRFINVPILVATFYGKNVNRDRKMQPLATGKNR